MPAKKRFITKKEISDWVGNYGYWNEREDWMLETLSDLANNCYSVEQFRKEVIAYNQQ